MGRSCAKADQRRNVCLCWVRWVEMCGCQGDQLWGDPGFIPGAASDVVMVDASAGRSSGAATSAEKSGMLELL